MEIVSANTIYLATIWAIPVIIAITFHEAAHGFVEINLTLQGRARERGSGPPAPIYVPDALKRCPLCHTRRT